MTLARRLWLAWRAQRLLRLSLVFAVRNAVASLNWHCQTCRNCGRIQRFEYHAPDWVDVVGHEGSILCVDCFLIRRGGDIECGTLDYARTTEQNDPPTGTSVR